MIGRVNSFQDKYSTRKLTQSELIRAIRDDISAEQDATNTYLSHADATDNKIAKKVLVSIANEERVHAGEFERLLTILTKDENKYQMKGAKEVNELLEKKKRKIVKKRK